MNLSACRALPPRRVSGTWYRTIPLGYIVTPLNVDHSKSTPSRFNPGSVLPEADQFSLLYMAQDLTTADFEAGAMVGAAYRPGRSFPNPHLTMVMLNVQVDLQSVVDLSSEPILRSISTTAQEMTGDWIGYQDRMFGGTNVKGSSGLAPTQELGWEMKKLGFEGFLAISAKISTNQNLIVFPENLRRGSSVEFQHPDRSLFRIDGAL